MSEPVAKQRPPVDFDAFDRRPTTKQDRRFDDPLAELARLVGEHHDPYHDVFADEARAPQVPQHQPVGRREPGFGPAAVSPRLSGDFAAIEAGLRGALSAHPEPQAATAPAYDGAAEHEFYAQNAEYPQGEQAYLQDHEDQQWAGEPQQRVTPAAASRSRKPVYVMAATIAVGVVGIGVAFAYKGASSGPREIRTIMAAAGPTKIQPPADATSDQGNQDAAILGKTGQAAPTQLVSREEQPVDLSQAVQENSSRDADTGTGGQGDAANVPVPPPPSQAAQGQAPDVTPQADQMQSFGMAGMPAPKRVKVVSVRPDGTILPNDAVPAAALPPQHQAPSMTSDPGSPIARASTPRGGATPKTTSRVATTPKPTRVAKADVADDAGDDASKPAAKPKRQKVASAEPTTGETDTTASTGAGGGFAVQLAAPGSEADARSASSRLAKKFSSALSGRHLAFHKAQSNGKSVYRVRVSSLSKDEAVSLCEKLKADGGSCFVAKN